MLVCIAWLGLPPDTNIQASQVVPITSALFVLGNILEWILNVYRNPFASLRSHYDVRKYFLMMIIAAVVVFSIFGATIYVYLIEVQTQNFDIFIPLLIVEFIVIFSIVAMNCKRITLFGCCWQSQNVNIL